MSKSDQNSLPLHVGLILDGNRRWAKQRGLPSFRGHQAGYDRLKQTVDAMFSQGISYISAFVFSTENWSRTKREVSFLMDLIFKMISRDLDEMNKKGIRIVWLGSKDRLSEKLINALERAENITKDNNRGTLALCFNYGGQQEIVDAAVAVTEQGERPTIELIEHNLYGSDVIPPIDFLIRTSGEKRISNFMLWRAAYSELYFTDVLWPDFTDLELNKALAEYAKRQRRFGK